LLVNTKMRAEDLTIVKAIKAGDKRAFNAFFIEYSPRLEATIYFLCNDKCLAEDLVQEAFLRLWKNRAELNEHQSLKGYLRTISKNLFLDHNRKGKTAQRYQESLVEPTSDEVSEKVIVNDLQQLVISGITRFSQDKQDMYVGSRFDGKTYYEIAQIKNTTPKAVERHVAKISSFIRIYLKKHYQIIIIFFLITAIL
jgi:RNA polymerase sigma factor (sigma-70 family)